MKILILGGTGMLGHRLWIELAKIHEVVATVRTSCNKINLPYIAKVDALNFQSIEKAIFEYRPDIVINCIGIIKQIDDSKSHLTSIEINSLLPHKIAEICKKISSRMIHFGTDCVFDGKKGMYLDSDKSNADDLYGRCKFLGEIDYADHVFTIRTSIIGKGIYPNGSLIDWFLDQKGKTIKGFKNAIFSGFPAKTISEIIEKHIIPYPELSGTFNISSDPISKFDLLSLVKKLYQADIGIVPDEDFKVDRSLDSTRFRKLTNFTPSPWESMIGDLNIDNELYS